MIEEIAEETTELQVIAPLNALICSPQACPIGQNCPIGPMPNLKCKLKEKYTKDVSSSIKNMFPMLTKDPVIMMKVEFLLIPLFDQLLKLKMAEYAHFNVIAQGKINPILAEMRKTIRAIEVMVDSIVEKQDKAVTDMDTINKGDSYYDMLFTDGVTSVDERVGFDRGLE